MEAAKRQAVLICEESMIHAVRLSVRQKFTHQDILVITPDEAKERWGGAASLAPEVLNIDGKAYVRAGNPEPKIGSGLKAALVAMAVMGGGVAGAAKKSKTLSDDIDIVEEFGLIQKKKSRLPKSERDLVVTIFNENYIAL